MKKSYVIKLESKEWNDCLDKAFKNRVKDIKVDGFRKGQVPKEVYIKKFGIESLYMDATDIALPIMYERLIKDKDTIKPVVSPSVDIKSINKDELEVEFTLVSAPEVKLGTYKNLKIKKEEVKVSKEEIEHELEHLKEQFIEQKIVGTDVKIKGGHIAIIDFEGSIDGKSFEGGKAENYSLTIGSNSFIPGFESSLIGMKTGEEKEINLKFPDDYHAEDLKGKNVVFKVKINEVKERILPKIDENFFKDLGIEGIDTKEKLEKEIENNIKIHKERHAEDEYVFKCLDTVVKNSKFEIPEEMIEEEIERMLKDFSDKLSLQGMNLDKYLEFTNSKIDDLKGQMKDEAIKRIGYRLVIDEVVKKEKIEVSDKELNDEIKTLADRYKMKKDEFIKKIGNKDIIKYDIQVKKAIEVITEIKKA